MDADVRNDFLFPDAAGNISSPGPGVVRMPTIAEPGTLYSKRRKMPIATYKAPGELLFAVPARAQRAETIDGGAASTNGSARGGMAPVPTSGGAASANGSARCPARVDGLDTSSTTG